MRYLYTIGMLLTVVAHLTNAFVVPSKRGGAWDDRAGECPSPLTFSGFCASQCRLDEHCTAPHKCCYNGCAHLCRLPKGMKEGQCPAATLSATEYKNNNNNDDCNVYCSRDKDCFGDQKCCAVGGCGGRQCVDAVSRPVGCAATSCAVGAECVENAQGVAECRPIRPPPPPTTTTTPDSVTSACATLLCPPGTQCRVSRYNDKPRCEPIKPGTCPEAVWNGPCVVECAHDADCLGTYKCCRYGCGQLCTKPSRQTTPPITCALVLCQVGFVCTGIPARCVPEQKSGEKPGKCPSITTSSLNSNIDEPTFCYFSAYNSTDQCSADSQCAGNLKCCQTPCKTRTCQMPQNDDNNNNNPCKFRNCGINGRCVVQNGQAVCEVIDRPATTPCGAQQCSAGETCVMRLSNSESQQQHGSPFQCLPKRDSPCSALNCAANGQDCILRQFAGGEPPETAVCVPRNSANLCNVLNICPADTGCRVRSPDYACVGDATSRYCQTVVECFGGLPPDVIVPPPYQKPGQCPTFPPDLVTICLARCSGDARCPGAQKCCNRGCESLCLDPAGTPPATTLPPPPLSCATILCPPGKVCVQPPCIGQQPQCPPPACVPQSPLCDRRQCDANMHCESVRTICPNPPCPRIPLCVPDSIQTCETTSEQTCPYGQHCELLQVQCVTTPCPPLPTCFPDDEDEESTTTTTSSPVCTDDLCPPSRHCELRVPASCKQQRGRQCQPQPHCVPNNNNKPTTPPPGPPSCDGVSCPYGQTCQLEQVQCITTPCYPQPQCVDDPEQQQSLSCDNISCSPGTHCELRSSDECREGGSGSCSDLPFCVPDGIGAYTQSPQPTTTTRSPPTTTTCDYPCKPGFACQQRLLKCPNSPCPSIPLCVPQQQQHQAASRSNSFARSDKGPDNAFVRKINYFPFRKAQQHYLETSPGGSTSSQR